MEIAYFLAATIDTQTQFTVGFNFTDDPNPFDTHMSTKSIIMNRYLCASFSYWTAVGESRRPILRESTEAPAFQDRVFVE